VNRSLVVAAALLALPAPLPAVAQAPAPAPLTPTARGIRVSGEGRVSVRPDVAVIQAGVEATGKDLAKVSAEVAAQTRRMLAALAATGVAEKDVQTVRHDVTVNRPWKDGTPGPITGYTVADELRVKIRDVSKVGAVLDRVVAAGANALRGLTFERDDPSGPERDALARAVADARAKAEVLARAGGVGLGEVLAIAEAVELAPRPMMSYAAMRKAEGADAPVSPGELAVSAHVEVTFAIGDVAGGGARR
jgi:uncharacterized protein